jgi:mannose-1-phosphate guanylyltransferase
MQAMILAAGVGSRMQPLTRTIPKPMLPVAGEPLLAHTIRWLQRAGVTDIALNLHHLPHVICDYFGDGAAWGVTLRYLFEPTLFGTAGSVKQLAHVFHETFVVVYGDLLIDINLAALVDMHRQHEALATIGLKPTDDPASQGMIVCDAQGRVTQFVEKPTVWTQQQRLANAGIYLVEPSVIDWIPDRFPSDWGFDVFPRLLAANLPVYGCPVHGQVVDIGTPAAYARVKDSIWSDAVPSVALATAGG